MKTSRLTLTRLWMLVVAMGAAMSLVAQSLQFTQVQRLASGEVALTLDATPGQAYRLEAATTLADWNALVTFPTNATGSIQYTDSAAAFLGGRFYRARQLTSGDVVSGDHLTTAEGDVIIQPRYHASFVLQWNGLMIYNDPDSPATLYQGLPGADLILISHEHGDHFDAAAIAAVKKDNTVIVAPSAVYNQGSMSPHRGQTIMLANGATTNVLGIEVEAVPAYNLPASQTIYHAKGNGNGYVLTLGGKRIYASGDTQDVPEMRALTNIDVAFVCMNLPFTMTVEAAADAVRAFRPRVVYPYHFSSSDVNRFKQLVGTDLGIEVRLRNWY